jgi:hypothetical protein
MQHFPIYKNTMISRGNTRYTQMSYKAIFSKDGPFHKDSVLRFVSKRISPLNIMQFAVLQADVSMLSEQEFFLYILIYFLYI